MSDIHEITHTVEYWAPGAERRETVGVGELTPPAAFPKDQKAWAQDIAFSLRMKGWETEVKAVKP